MRTQDGAQLLGKITNIYWTLRIAGTAMPSGGFPRAHSLDVGPDLVPRPPAEKLNATCKPFSDKFYAHTHTQPRKEGHAQMHSSKHSRQDMLALENLFAACRRLKVEWRFENLSEGGLRLPSNHVFQSMRLRK